MIFIQALGAAAIHVGAKRLLPNAARAFATLLYLSEERNRRVTRAELQSVLFPQHRADQASHGLRQLLYGLRRRGVPIGTPGELVVLAKDAVTFDYTELRVGSIPPETASAVTTGILPGYAPSFSKSYAQWVDQRRTVIERNVARTLALHLAELRRAGRWSEIEPIAKAVLALDSLNEEGTLGLAEALAMSGQKARAVQTLDRYLAEVKQFGADVRISARLLRHRISEAGLELAYRQAGPAPFIGRDGELASLWEQYQHARARTPQLTVLHGEPGIGKTRLASEFMKAATLDGATCVRVECSSHDVRRPLGVFVDLVPKLLDAPGGLGVDPASLEHLRRLTVATRVAQSNVSDLDPQRIYELIVAAIVDLVDAVADERPLVVLIDDAQFIDPASLETVLALGSGEGARRLVVILTSRQKFERLASDRGTDGLRYQKVRALAASAAAALLVALQKQRGLRADAGEHTRLLELAAGNPLYLLSLVDDAPPRETGTTVQAPTLTDLLTQRVQKLSDSALRTFVACVLLAKHCRLDRLVRVVGADESDLLAAVQSLETQGLLRAEDGDVRSSHPLLSQIALEELPPLTLRLMHGKVAEVLEAEAVIDDDNSTLWHAAEHWHAAGETHKAINLLASCADYLIRIGRPRQACELLIKVCALAPRGRQPEIHRALIEAARLAEDHSRVLASISAYRALDHDPDPTKTHDELEIVAIQAQRNCGTPLTELVVPLRTCVFEPGLSPSHRLRAAPQLLAAYDLLLDRREAASTFAVVSKISTASLDDEVNQFTASTIFNCLAGTPSETVSSARSLIQRLNEIRHSPRHASLLVDAAAALFRSGEMAEGMQYMQAALDFARSRGMKIMSVNASSMLAWMYYAVDDAAGWRRFETMADDLVSQLSGDPQPIAHYLSNKIEFALERREVSTAKYWLEKAETAYREIHTPRSRAVATAFALRVRQLETGEAARIVTLTELEGLHSLASACGLHDNFVEAYWYELALLGEVDRANDMLRTYLKCERRDQFPTLPPVTRLKIGRNDH